MEKLHEFGAPDIDHWTTLEVDLDGWFERRAADVAACAALGASIVHLHARDAHGRPSHRGDHFAPIVEGIREIDPELVVCVTCSGRFTAALEDRAEVLELSGQAKPDMASLTLGSNNFVDQTLVNAPVIRGLAKRMRSAQIKPELGSLGTSPLSSASLAALQSVVPGGWTWSVGGVGRHQLDANLLGIAAGGGVCERLGLAGAASSEVEAEPRRSLR